jgi:Leucine-rich repeat (LRR) protein
VPLKLAEAERRIEEARRTQAESLDLGDLALYELPTSMGGLPHLKALYLGMIRPTEEGDLEHDYFRTRPEFTDLSNLTRLRGLQSLNLWGCHCVTDLSPLAELQALQSLDLSDFEGVTDLYPLARLQGLQSLNLWGCRGVTILLPLARLQGLKNLDLSHCSGVTDLSPWPNSKRFRSSKCLIARA